MAASSPPPARATKSTSTTEKAEGFHRFEVRNYSLMKDLGTGNPARSSAFPVGGYDWCVLFYPSGGPSPRCPKGYACVYVQLMTSGAATARARFLVRIVNPAPAASGRSRLFGHAGSGLYSSDETSTNAKLKQGIKLMTRTWLEAAYLDRDSDRFIIECTLTVIGEPSASAMTPLGIRVPPPSDLPAHPPESRELTFDVRGPRFAANRLVFAMRSPGFMAELFGPMSEVGCITIGGVDPAVLKALLDIIYSDSYPAMDDLDEDANRELARHLLAAADRYGMHRLKAQCESILSTSLNAQTVVSTLALADRHGCHQLKDACVEFIITNNGSVARCREDDQLKCSIVLLSSDVSPRHSAASSKSTKSSQCLVNSLVC